EAKGTPQALAIGGPPSPALALAWRAWPAAVLFPAALLSAGYWAWTGVSGGRALFGWVCWTRLGSTRIWSSSALVKAGSALLPIRLLSIAERLFSSPPRLQAASASRPARAGERR